MPRKKGDAQKIIEAGDGYTVATGDGVKHALKLEQTGFRSSRSVSLRKAWAVQFDMPPRSSYLQVLERLDQEIKALELANGLTQA